MDTKELLKRKLTMLGTEQENKPELPPELLTTKNRPVKTSMFVFMTDAFLVFYMPKKCVTHEYAA